MCIHWYFQWFTVLFLAVTVAAGLAYRAFRTRPTVPQAVPEAEPEPAAG